MARGHYRKQRYIVRLADGRGIGASSAEQVKKLAEIHKVDCIETETGDMDLDEFEQQYNSTSPRLSLSGDR